MGLLRQHLASGGELSDHARYSMSVTEDTPLNNKLLACP